MPVHYKPKLLKLGVRINWPSLTIGSNPARPSGQGGWWLLRSGESSSKVESKQKEVVSGRVKTIFCCFWAGKALPKATVSQTWMKICKSFLYKPPWVPFCKSQQQWQKASGEPKRSLWNVWLIWSLDMEMSYECYVQVLKFRLNLPCSSETTIRRSYLNSSGDEE